MAYPLKLEETDLTTWGSLPVPAGANQGRTFLNVYETGRGTYYRNRDLQSHWARSLKAYVNAMDTDSASRKTYETKNEAGGASGKTKKAGGASGSETKNDADSDDMQTIELKVPANSNIMIKVQIPSTS